MHTGKIYIKIQHSLGVKYTKSLKYTYSIKYIYIRLRKNIKMIRNWETIPYRYHGLKSGWCTLMFLKLTRKIKVSLNTKGYDEAVLLMRFLVWRALGFSYNKDKFDKMTKNQGWFSNFHSWFFLIPLHSVRHQFANASKFRITWILSYYFQYIYNRLLSISILKNSNDMTSIGNYWVLHNTTNMNLPFFRHMVWCNICRVIGFFPKCFTEFSKFSDKHTCHHSKRVGPPIVFEI